MAALGGEEEDAGGLAKHTPGVGTRTQKNTVLVIPYTHTHFFSQLDYSTLYLN